MSRFKNLIFLLSVCFAVSVNAQSPEHIFLYGGKNDLRVHRSFSVGILAIYPSTAVAGFGINLGQITPLSMANRVFWWQTFYGSFGGSFETYEGIAILFLLNVGINNTRRNDGIRIWPVYGGASLILQDGRFFVGIRGTWSRLSHTYVLNPSILYGIQI